LTEEFELLDAICAFLIITQRYTEKAQRFTEGFELLDAIYVYS